MAKGNSGVRWVGDSGLIAENKSATASYDRETGGEGDPNPRSGGPGIGMKTVSRKPARKAYVADKPAEKKVAPKPAEKGPEVKVDSEKIVDLGKKQGSSVPIKKKK